MMDPPLKALVDLFARFPGIGEKTALRLVLHLLQSPAPFAEALGSGIATLRREMRPCERCRAWTSSSPCATCLDLRRDDSLLCVVSSEPDLWAIEKAGVYRGRYFVLHGLLSPLDGVGPEDLGLGDLERLVAGGKIREMIVALRSSMEGEATALFLAKRFADRVSVTRPASGLPHGGEIEYADQVTLAHALEGRRKV